MRALRFEPSPIFPTSRLKAKKKMPIERKSDKTIWGTMKNLHAELTEIEDQYCTKCAIEAVNLRTAKDAL